MGEGEEAKKPFFLAGLINERVRSSSFFMMRKMEEEKNFIIL